MEAASGVFVRLLLADNGFPEQIDGKSDFFLPPFAQHLHHVVRISPGDELPRHPGNVPAQNRRGEPRKDARRAQAGLQERHHGAVAHVGKVFVQMLDDVAGTAQ